jgi:hypothetical protein
MDLSLTEGQLKFRAEVAELVSNEVSPRATKFDRTGQFPWEKHQKVCLEFQYLWNTVA